MSQNYQNHRRFVAAYHYVGSLLRLRERSGYRRQVVRALGKLAPQLSQLVIPLPQLQPQPITLGSQPRPFPLSLQ